MTVALAEDEAIALCAEGAAFEAEGDSVSAIGRYRAAVDRAPALLDLHLVLANALLLSNDVLGARETLRQAVRVAYVPDAGAAFRLGKALVDSGAGADAIPCFRRARLESPRNGAAVAALAAALRDAHQAEAAWREVSHALRIDPNDPVALHTAALVRHDLADYSGALKWCERSLKVRPDSAGTRVTRGYLRCLLGDERGGLSDFESRPCPRPASNARLWAGEPLNGQTILVMGEQGIGDQLQFLRFVQHQALHAATRVVVAVQAQAVSLLREAGFDAIARDETIDTDWYVPLLSLPFILGEGATWRCATGVPYLRLPECGDTFATTAVRRVGLVWAGNPAHRNDAARSIPLSLLDRLLHNDAAAQFVCLQHGIAGTSLPAVLSERPNCADWLATARVLQTLDLLITVDTGIAHLAGAMGLPTWILLPHVPDWRWGASGDRTAWYPTVRLFRQSTQGDWARVLSDASAALSHGER